MSTEAQTTVDIRGDARIIEMRGIPHDVLESAAPFVSLSRFFCADLVGKRVTLGVDLAKFHVRTNGEYPSSELALMQIREEEARDDMRRWVREAALSPRVSVAIAEVAKDPAPYRYGATRIQQYGFSDNRSRAGGYYIIPRLVREKGPVQVVHPKIETCADRSSVHSGVNEAGENTVCVCSFDGVTVPDSGNDPDVKAASIWIKSVLGNNSNVLFSDSHIGDIVVALNNIFTTASSNPLRGTLSVARMTEKKDGRREVDIAVVGDAKASVVWIDKNNIPHVVTVENPVNAQIDKVATIYTHAHARTGDDYYNELVKRYYANTYLDKFNHGAGSVPIMGVPGLSRTDVVCAHVVIPADAKFFKVLTYTDGIELYALTLGIPPWLCALLFEPNESIEPYGPINQMSVAPYNSEQTLFFGVMPFGIAAQNAIHALLNPLAYPIDAQLRDKWDDASAATYGGRNEEFFDLFLRLFRSEQVKVTVPSYTNEVQRLAEWFIDRVSAPKEPYIAYKGKPRKRRR